MIDLGLLKTVWLQDKVWSIPSTKAFVLDIESALSSAKAMARFFGEISPSLFFAAGSSKLGGWHLIERPALIRMVLLILLVDARMILGGDIV